jgi:acetoin utilization deacetylase AcuC-like enzyme
MHVFYSPIYAGSDYAFDTTRKSRWIAESLLQAPISGIVLEEPVPLEAEQLKRVHDPTYVEAVRTGSPKDLAESQGFVWDAKLWPMVLASNGGVVAAARAALGDGVAGSLSSGLHHARAARGAGFCTFNGLAIAAKQISSESTKRVLILDLDAHCGGGTESLIRDDPAIWQVDVSVVGFDCYHGSDRIRVHVVDRARDYLPTIRRRLNELDEEEARFDLCIYNAGMDPHEDCSTGGLRGITTEVLAEREKLVFDWCTRRNLPIAFVLAGGYAGLRLDERGLVSLHRLTLSEAAKHARIRIARG